MSEALNIVAAVPVAVIASAVGASDSLSVATEVNEGLSRCAEAYRSGDAQSAFNGWRAYRSDQSFCNGCADHSGFVSPENAVHASIATTRDSEFACSIYHEWTATDLGDEVLFRATRWLQDSLDAGEIVQVSSDCWREGVPVVAKIKSELSKSAFIAFGAYKTDDGAVITANVSNQPPYGSCS